MDGGDSKVSARARRLPPWLKRRWPEPAEVEAVLALLRELRLETVCQQAHCPNLGECFARRTATFMILGRVCTRNCTFCAVEGGSPMPPDPGEPERVAEAVLRLGLSHVVVTSVTRDDLPDGGSSQFARTVEAVRRRCHARAEVLTPDFGGSWPDVDGVLDSRPDVFNHNIETVPRLYSEVRPQADYDRSLAVLSRATERGGGCVVKSGLMVGLGETREELVRSLRDLLDAGCESLTIGQYLRPSPAHLPVARYLRPQEFEELKEAALRLGFRAVASAPFVRSSYHAAEQASDVLAARGDIE